MTPDGTRSAILQAGHQLPAGLAYLPASPENCIWGYLPSSEDAPVLTVEPGETFIVDTISHEGILDDQGGDPEEFFAGFGIDRSHLLDDTVHFARSARREPDAGPHVVVGPIEVRGARPGDVLIVDVVDLACRVDYGIVSNRHGRGALPGEMPARGVDVVSRLCRTAPGEGGVPVGVMEIPGLRAAGGPAAFRFPLRPFLGIMGAATTTPGLSSIPPGRFGGNLDVSLLGVGTRLYLPVTVDGAGFYVGDPHYAQGNGEVALTAFEAPLRATLRLSLHRGANLAELALLPIGETDEIWVPIGLDLDLREATRDCVRRAISFLGIRHGVDSATALAYLSATVDFSISQVVDVVNGVHAAIRKADLDGLAQQSQIFQGLTPER